MFCWRARAVMSSPNHSSEEISALHAWDECLPAAVRPKKKKRKESALQFHPLSIN